MNFPKTYFRSLSIITLSLAILTSHPVSAEDNTSSNEVTSSQVTTKTPEETTTVTITETTEETTSAENTTVTSETIQTVDANDQTQVSEPSTSQATAQNGNPIIPMPSALVGTWTGNTEKGTSYTFTFNPDGTGQRIIHSETGDKTVDFRIDSVQLVGENTYRFVAGDKTYEIAETGFGGSGVKYDNGFYLAGDKFSPIMWQVLAEEDFDYSQGMQSEILYIREVPKAELKAEAQQISNTNTPSAKTTSTAKETKNLPQTGEKNYILLSIFGLLLISIPVFMKLKKK